MYPADLCATRDVVRRLGAWTVLDYRGTESPVRLTGTHAVCSLSHRLWVPGSTLCDPQPCPLCGQPYWLREEQRRSVLILPDARLVAVDLPGVEERGVLRAGEQRLNKEDTKRLMDFLNDCDIPFKVVPS